MTAPPSACRQCGAEPRQDARFCDACGSPLEAETQLTEYKQVTVLFADVVRSMDIAAAVGPERLRELMTELVERSGSVVQRYGGTMNQFTGDGFMAVFGAPVAMEDHALRACLAALDIQDQARSLAGEVQRRDGIALALRIGLNSGEVVVGDIDAGPMKYTVSGQQVGIAQRMESVAAPGAVMLSESTARLVQDEVALGDRVLVRIKGASDPVPTRALLAVDGDRHRETRRECRLVGRLGEKAAIGDALRRAIEGSGGTVAIAGPPGIGKSRLVRESLEAAKSLGADVFPTYCESHTGGISFHVIARSLRSAMGVDGLPPDTARARIRGRLRDADEQDIILLDDLLGIRDAEIPMPDISPDARRRRLVEILNDGAIARPSPAVYVVEDVHWIDAVSEALIAELAAVLHRTRSLMLVTYRPEYRGSLSHAAGSHTITLAPLDDSQSTELTTELLGTDSSVGELSRLITARAAGVPFFAEEMVRDLAERGVLDGERGGYVCLTPVGDIDVPATLQATIGARIDRLDAAAKRTLHAAAVIGARFSTELLERLTPDAEMTGLVEAELIEHESLREYAFRHPLIQKVAYDSQLRSDRAKLHRRLAMAIEQADENAALIAMQWEAAGDFPESFEWHMRAGAWLNYRDHPSARTSWQRARDVADRLPTDDPARLTKQIAPRTLICATAFRVGGTAADTGFDELQGLTTAAGDKRSLAIGMAGYLTTLAFTSHHRDASRLASEFVTLVESIGDPVMTVGLLPAAAQAKYEAGDSTECLRLAERVIQLADGDPAMGNIMVASPLAWAFTLRGTARMCHGSKGWRRDLNGGVTLALGFDIQSICTAALYKYVLAMQNYAVIPDATDLVHTAEWFQTAEQSGDDTAIALVSLIRAVTLTHYSPKLREAGVSLLSSAYDRLARLSGGLRRFADIELAKHRARTDDLDGAIDTARTTIDEQFNTGEMISRGSATTVLVEALLQRSAQGDLRAARTAIDRLAAVPTQPGFALHELPILRLRALLARAEDDDQAFDEFVERYRSMADRCGYAGHVAAADAMRTRRGDRT